MVTSVTLCGGDTLSRHALARTLSTLPDIHLVSQAPSLSEVVRDLGENRPDVLILSTDELTQEVAAEFLGLLPASSDEPPLRLLVLVPTVLRQHLWLYSHGRCAVLPRSVTPEAVAATLQMMKSGFMPIATASVRDLRDTAAAPGHVEDGAGYDRAVLSKREDEILQLLGDGLTNLEISERLCLATSTIKAYIKQVFRKLHVRNRTEAALLIRRPVLGSAVLA